MHELILVIKNPLLNRDLLEFKNNVSRVRSFISIYQKDFFNTAKKFTCIEARRIGEALSCFNRECYLAASILTVSALEARLHTLIRGRTKKEYDSFIKEAPLGRIIWLRDAPNSEVPKKFEEIKRVIYKVIPDKHLPLMKLLNQYRIFSAHPKDESIDYNLAHSIISLSFAFLLDKKLGIPEELCVSGQAPAF